MQDFQVSRTFFCIHHGNIDSEILEKTSRKAKDTGAFMRPGSRTLVEGITLSSLPRFSMTWILSAPQPSMQQVQQTN